MQSNKAPLVSILIPSYNHSSYIHDCIRSAISQTYKNIELLIVDDGSPDNSFDKILEMEPQCRERFQRVLFDQQKNQGIVSSLNRLINASQGEFCYILASDDIAKPQAISTLVNFLVNNPEYLLAVGDNEIINANGTRVFWDKNRRNVMSADEAVFSTFGEFLQQKSAKIDFLSEAFGSYASLLTKNYVTNGYLLRSNFLKTIGGYREDTLEDYYMNLQIAKHGKMKYIPEILFSYRWHGENTVLQNEKMAALMKKTLKVEKTLVEKDGTKQQRNLFYFYHGEKNRIFRLGSFLKIYKSSAPSIIMVKLFGRIFFFPYG